MRVHSGFLVVLMALTMSLVGVVHLEAAAAQQTDGGQQNDGGAPPHDDGGPPVEEYRSEDSSGGGEGLGWALLLIVALVIINRVLRVHGRTTRRPKVTASSRPVRRNSRKIPQDVKIAVSVRDKGSCRSCGSSKDLQYDHIYPYSLGGSSTDVTNIQLLCGKCNRRKSNRYVG